MNRKILLGIILIILAVVVLILVRFFSGEDNWVCEDGKWVKHGFPKAEVPTTLCR